jgi:hypothetical protein
VPSWSAGNISAQLVNCVVVLPLVDEVSAIPAFVIPEFDDSKYVASALTGFLV